jgi:hypothetical protein
LSGVRKLRDNFKIPVRCPAVKEGSIQESEAKKGTYLIELDVRKRLVETISRRSEEAETLQPGLEFDKFKPLLTSGIFKCTSCWLNGSFFGGR